MKKAQIRGCVLFAVVLQATAAYSQQIDQRLLEDLRKRYQYSFESIYVADSALNNLSVHLRTERNINSLTKSGTSITALNILRKFLVEIAHDRAFLQLELRALRAGFKKHSDASPTIQPLPWTQGEVFHIALLCDRYLQGQLLLASFKKQLAAGGISVIDGWTKLDELRQDPYVPVVTMTDSLKDFAAYAERNESQLNALATTNPSVYNGIRTFKTRLADRKAPVNMYFSFDWPSVVKSEWIQRYKVLESYGQSVDKKAFQVWRRQLDNLQDIEYAQLVRTTPSPKAD